MAAKKMKVWELTSENMSGMSTQGSRPKENFHQLYQSAESAKAAAEKDYKGEIDWTKRGKTISSGDLLWVMYTIREIEVLP